MSDLLNQASLVMIPSGYKEDVVYSQIPTSGAGDLSFTRASNGTRINSAGLVEVCPWNELTYSEDFDNAAWSKYQSAITANATTAPNGTTTAEKFNDTAVSDAHIIYRSAALVANTYTLTIYAKAAERSVIYMRFDNSTAKYAYFDLANGVVLSANAAYTASIQNAGDGWYRCSVAITATAATYDIVYGVTTGNGVVSYLGNGTGIYIWGAQLNIGATAKPYFPTTDRLNVPRLTYQNGGGGCPSLLLEKQSTNLLTYSEQFDIAPWTLDGDGVGQSVTANYSISPDGTQNADRLQLNKTGGTYSRIRQDKSGAGTYAWTVYMKSNTSASQNIGLRLDSTAINCVVTTSWQRFTLNATVVTPQAQILLFDSIVGNDEIADISVWGAQLEASSYPTSYIPTTSSSATRVADACFKTGISSLIGQTEGVVFVDFVYNGIATNGTNIFNMNRNVTSSVYIVRQVNSTIEAAIAIGGVGVAKITGGSITVGTRFKLAYAYKSGSSALYINGTQIGTSSTAYTIVTSMSEINLNDVNTYFQIQEAVNFNQCAIFPTRLTNAELASLTTI